MTVQAGSLRACTAGWKIDPGFAHRNAAKQTVRRPRKHKEKALRPGDFKAFPVAGAKGLEVASQPLLRCPKGSSSCRFSSIFSTAAPSPARCIRRRRCSQAPRLRCPKGSSGCRFFSIFSTAAPTPARCIRHRRCLQAPPLAVPETADARFHSRRFDRCANPCSLYPPPAALAGVARHAVLERLSGKEKSPKTRRVEALAASQNRF